MPPKKSIKDNKVVLYYEVIIILYAAQVKG
jgi:hypothetical protein